MSDSQSNRLDGWKAIADHLGRDARTAQRWHHDRGMPVHHVAGARSGGVFAYRAELDLWLETGASSSTAPVSPEPPPRSPEPSQADTQTAPGNGPARRRPRLVIASAAALLLAGVASLALFSNTATTPHAIPTQFTLKNTALSATDAEGNVLWTAPLPNAADGTNDRGGAQAQLEKTLTVDLDGDATSELVAVVHYVNSNRRGIHDAEVYSFTATGAFLWRYRPSRLLTFTGRQFGAPWRVHASAVTGSPAVVWLAYIHRTWWPSFVVRLGQGGTEQLRFVNSGHIEALQSLTTAGKRLMLAAGFNNEFMLPAMAAFEEDGPPVTSPQTAGTPFLCDECPRDQPSLYLLFPRSDVNVALGAPFVSVSDIETPDDRGFLEVSVRQPDQGLRAIYRLSANHLAPQSVAFSDAHWAMHRKLSAAGTLDHPPELCPERQEGVVVRVWQAVTGWTEVRVPPLFMAKGPE